MGKKSRLIKEKQNIDLKKAIFHSIDKAFEYLDSEIRKKYPIKLGGYLIIGKNNPYKFDSNGVYIKPLPNEFHRQFDKFNGGF